MSFYEFSSNSMYVEGEGVLYEIKRYSHNLGSRFLIITGCGPITESVMEIIKESFDNSMESNVQKSNLKYDRALKSAQRLDKENKKIEYKFIDYEGKQVTLERIEELASIVKNEKIDVVVGVGGGKALDFARGAHIKTGVKVVLVPTSSATNAPATGLIVVYSEEGILQEICSMDGLPDVVIADTSILIDAPAKTIVAGIGDCIGTCFETLVNIKLKDLRPKIADNAWYAVEAQKNIFYNNGYLALQSIETKTITQAFESTVAIILNMSGPYRSVVSMNLAHVLDEVLLHFEPCRRLPHGYIIGYAVIPMLIYANFPRQEIFEYIDFATSIGLPVNLDQLGISDVSHECLEKVSEIVASNEIGSAARSGNKFNKDDFWKNIILADKLVNDYISSKYKI